MKMKTETITENGNLACLLRLDELTERHLNKNGVIHECTKTEYQEQCISLSFTFFVPSMEMN